jgi:putative porin
MRVIKARRRASWLARIIMMGVMSVATLGWGADLSNTNTSDPLLDLFIKKGFVTQKEAEQVEAEAEALRANQSQMPPAPLSRWKISQGIKSVQFFGDIRLRYEDREAQDPEGDKIELQRYRYAVRVGLRGDLVDNVYYGFRIETSSNPRSSFVTLGTASAPSSSNPAYQGPFGKSTAGLAVGQIYIGWRPWDWVDITLGKMPNPLYTTPLLWSGSINPEGAAEQFKLSVGNADFFANFGQFLYQDMNPVSTSGFLDVNGIADNNNIFLFAEQGGLTYHITTNVSAKIGATIYSYYGLKQSTSTSGSTTSPYYGDTYIGEGQYAGPGSGTGIAYQIYGYSGFGTGNGLPGSGSLNYPNNQVGLNNLLVLEIPFEFNFKIDQWDARVFGDYAYNLYGNQRAEAAATGYKAYLASVPAPGATISGFAPQTQDVKAYQFGLDLGTHGDLGLVSGSTSRKHAWEVKTYWQHVEQYSLDPNLLDTDFFEGNENLEGIYVAAAYSLTDNLVAAFRYGHASRINKLLGTGGTGQDIPQINPINDFDIYQVDLTLRF